MKKLIYLIAAAVLFTACSKDDETPNYIDKNIIGTWKLEYYYIAENSNTINFADTINLIKTDYPTNNLIFSDENCGLLHKFNEMDFCYSSYNTNNNNNIIHITKHCSYENISQISIYAIILFIGIEEEDVPYIISNDILTIAYSNKNIGERIIYSVYKRKQ
jgi:hypothetical protein